MTRRELSVRARVRGIEAADFEQQIQGAGELCPVSNALRGNVEVSVHGELEV